MATHDNIADAYEFPSTFGTHTADFDNTGATMETNEEDNAEGYPSVWAKIVLTDYAIISYSAENISGAVDPYMDPMWVIDYSFDPSNPDFSKLGWGPINYFHAPDRLVEDNIAPPGIYYLFIGDYYGVNEGVQRVTITLSPYVPTTTNEFIVTPDRTSFNYPIDGYSVEFTLSPGASPEQDLRYFAWDLPGWYPYMDVQYQSTSGSGGWTRNLTFSQFQGSNIPPGQYKFLVQIIGQTTGAKQEILITVIIPPVICVNAHDDPNTANPYITIGADYVMDAQTYDWSTDNLEGNSDLLATCYVRGTNLPPPGVYGVKVHFKNSAYPTMFIKRNGLALYPHAYLWSGSSNDVDPYVTGREDSNSGPGPSKIGIASGDVLEIVMWGDSSAQLEKICFEQYSLGGSLGPTVKMLSEPEVVGASNGLDTWESDISFDDTYEVGQADIAVTDDGNIYVAQILWNPSNHNQGILGLKKWDGASWSTVTNNLWDLGYQFNFNTLPGWSTYSGFYGGSLSMDTDGTDLYIAFPHPDGTVVHVGSYDLPNTRWRVKKYSPASNTFTELGSSSGQRAIINRVNHNSEVGLVGEMLRLKVGPDGKVWIAWSENDDSANWNADKPHLWYYEGGSWHPTTPPDPPDLTNVNFWQLRYVWDVITVDFAFRNHSGPSIWPSVFYAATYTYIVSPLPQYGGTSVGNYIYSEYNGSSWSNTLQFFADDMGFIMGEDRYGHGTLGQPFWDWWAQGFSLLDTSKELLLFICAGHSGYSDRGIVAKLKPDGSAFETLSPGIGPNDTGAGFWSYLGDPYRFSTGRWGAGWEFPSVDAAADSKGNVFCLFTTSTTDQFADQVIMLADPGTGDGWMLASKKHQPFSQTYSPHMNGLCFDKDDNFYVVQSFAFNNHPRSGVNVLKFGRENYVPFGVGAGPLWFYRDGQWRNAGTDTEHNVYLHREGEWRAVKSDPEHNIHARLDGTWQPA